MEFVRFVEGLLELEFGVVFLIISFMIIEKLNNNSIRSGRFFLMNLVIFV